MFLMIPHFKDLDAIIIRCLEVAIFGWAFCFHPGSGGFRDGKMSPTNLWAQAVFFFFPGKKKYIDIRRIDLCEYIVCINAKKAS